MDVKLKQRLTGAMVLFALAIIIIPLIFDPQRIDRVAFETEIPPAPEMVMVDIPKPRVPEVSSSTRRPSEMYQLQPSTESSNGVAATKPAPVAVANKQQPSANVAVSSPATQSTGNAPALAKPTQAAVSPPQTAETPSLSDYQPQAGALSDPILDSQGAPQAWVVQVASFRQLERARLLASQLNEKGYRAFTRSVSVGELTSNRVYVGPKVSRERVEAIKQQLDQELKVQSLILKFEP